MNNNLGLNIKNYRKNKGFTQEELAGMLGVTPQAISRWESEAGLPDVSMIVPIAQALNITTDMLLGYNVANQDDYLATKLKKQLDAMWDISDTKGSALKCTEFLAEESNKNPMNFEICLMYVQEVAGLSYYIDIEGLLSDNPQRAEAILEDGIKKGVNIIRYASNQRLIDNAHCALAWIYIHKKDFSNAREHINVLPSLENNIIKESIFGELVFFEQGFDAMKDSLMSTNKLIFDILAKQLNSIVETYAYNGNKEEALENIEWAERVVESYATCPQYTSDERLKFIVKRINHNKMIVFDRAGDKEKANEICENYLKQIKDNNVYSEEEYESIAKEFRERIYQL